MNGSAFFQERKLPLISIVIFYFVLLIIWEGAFRFNFIKSIYFPTPSRIIKTLLFSIISGEWWLNFFSTFMKFIIAFLPGVLFGIFTGWIISLNKILKAIIAPIFLVIYIIPRFLFDLLYITFLGKSGLLGILPIFFVAFILATANSLVATESIKPVFFDICKNFSANRFKVFTNVVIPASLPLIYIGLQVVMVVCLRIIVISEFITEAKYGIGAFIWKGLKEYNFENMWIGLLTILFFVLAMSSIIKLFKKIFIPWRE